MQSILRFTFHSLVVVEHAQTGCNQKVLDREHQSVERFLVSFVLRRIPKVVNHEFHRTVNQAYEGMYDDQDVLEENKIQNYLIISCELSPLLRSKLDKEFQ